MSLGDKWRRIVYYYTKTPKGRFELKHLTQFLLLITVCILLLEAVLYLWEM